MIDLKKQILEMSRQDQTDPLSPWFDGQLDDLIDGDLYGYNTVVFPEIKDLYLVGNSIIDNLKDYRKQTGVSTAVIGMSGGVDSALAAVLFRDAGWNVIGVTMPIYQDPEDTERGKEACKELGIEHKHMDLTHQYEFFFSSQSGLDFGLVDPDLRDDKSVKIRLGNIRARLRMITLYNLAAANNGLVISTDNYSELAMGFWTLHGDVGDVSPIQSLGKSWEVPMLAKLWKVPESIWKAKPTDGLGVDDGDEAQFGFTYLELDIMLFSIAKLVGDGLASDNLENAGGINKKNIAKALSIEFDPHAVDVFELVMQRIGSTWFKRMNPINIVHPLDGRRYVELDHLDEALFHPDVVGG